MIAAAGLALPADAAAQASAASIDPWRPVQTLTPNRQANSSTEMVMSPAGVTALAWTATDAASTRQIMATVRLPGGDTDTDAVDGDLVPTADGDIAVNDAGDAIVVFQEQSGTYSRLYTAFRPADAGAWGAPQPLPAVANEHAGNADVALDPDGNAIVAWSSGANGGSIRTSVRDVADGTFGAVDTITGAADAQLWGVRPQVAFDGSGRATVAFTSAYDWRATGKVSTATRVAGGTFADAATVDTGIAEQITSLEVEANDAGDVMVWWVQYSGSWPQLIRALHRKSDASAFDSAPKAIRAAVSGTGTLQNDSADVAMDADGDAVALWYDKTARGASYDEDAGTWAEDPTAASPSARYGVRVAMSDGGTAVAAWPEGSVIKTMKRSAPTTGASGAWGAAEDVSDGGYANGDALVGTDDEGNVALAWRHIATSNAPYQVKVRLFDNAAPENVALGIPETVGAGDEAEFFADFEDRVSGVTVSWDFGDGGSATGTDVTHTFAEPGSYDVEVTAVDEAGRSAEPITQTVEVADVTPPETTIDSVTKTNGDPVVAFSATDDIAGELTYACTIDSVAVAGCASPQTLAGLGEGSHTFTVAATDAAGNTDTSPATRTFVVDRTAPTASITGAPAGPTKATDVELGLTSADPDATFLCALDGSEPEACSSPYVLSGKPDGTYEVAVLAVDRAGNVSATAAKATIVIDRTGPATQLLSGPQGRTNANPVRFTFEAVGDGAATFACSLDDVALDACPSPLSLPGVGEGQHELKVRAIDALGNEGSPVSRSFVVDRTAPVVTVGSPADGSQTSDPTPTLSGKAGRASGDESLVSWGVWAGEDLDAEPVQHQEADVAADGTWQTTLEALPLGTYTALVAQYDEALNYEMATITFRVVAPPTPETPVEDPPVQEQQSAQQQQQQPQPTPVLTPPTPRPDGTTRTEPKVTANQAVGQALIGSTGVFERLGVKAWLKAPAVPVPFTSPGPGAISVQVLAPTGRARAAAGRKARPVVVAKGTRRVGAAGTTQVKVKLTGAGRKLLKRARELRLTVRTSFTPKGGKAVSASRKMSVRAKGRK